MKQPQRALIEINYNRGLYNCNSIKQNGSYFIWYWVEFSKAKNKRRKKNKQARKQRKLNNRNHGKN